jgi:L-lactate dehydrogenase complex protein LldF
MNDQSALLPRVPFEEAAKTALRNTQLRRNMGFATSSIRAKRGRVVAEMPDWTELRAAGARIKDYSLAHLDEQLLQLEESVTRAGGVVHWARNGEDANRIVSEVVHGHGAREVVKVKSNTTDEISLNEALGREGVDVLETDLAEFIIQLADESSSHILVPAIHKNRAEIRELFMRKLGVSDLSDRPAALAEGARRNLRQRFLSAEVAVSGANFAVAETGAVCVVESEGNGRMCLTLPRVLITLMGIEKVVPTWQDMEVFLQLLPRSATGERMNPYTTCWTGVTPGDGPQEFHLILLDNERTRILADKVGRQTLRCIKCSACLNVCPVYSRTGGHAYQSIYPGPIGAILTPQLVGVEKAPSLPYASSLCGACYEVCPVNINIPVVLVHLRSEVVRRKKKKLRGRIAGEPLGMTALAWTFSQRGRYERAQRTARVAQKPLVRDGWIERLPGELSGWTIARDLRAVPPQAFRDWWKENR